MIAPRKVAVPAGVAVALIIPGLAWTWSTGNPLYYLVENTPPGQTAYVASRLAGLLGLSLFWLQALGGLLRGTGAA